MSAAETWRHHCPRKLRSRQHYAFSALFPEIRELPTMTGLLDLERQGYGFRAAKLCFKAHWVLNWIVYSSMGGAKRTMVKDILAEIDAEIARLKQAKALLSASGAVIAKRKPGRPAKVATACDSEGSEDQEAPQDERRGTGARPAGADQAMGCIEGRIQGEHERHGCASCQRQRRRPQRLLDVASVFDSRPGCGLNRKMQTATAT